jgi:response regulator NasT
LAASEREPQLEELAFVLETLGYEVVARSVEVALIGDVVAEQRPDIAIVSLGASSDHALEMIERIVRKATCPVIALLHDARPGFVAAASDRGVFAAITDRDPSIWPAAVDVALHRHGELRDLQEAFARRATIERANGILMERHTVDADRAFALLRGHSRSSNRKLIDVANAVLDGHALLPAQAPTSP